MSLDLYSQLIRHRLIWWALHQLLIFLRRYVSDSSYIYIFIYFFSLYLYSSDVYFMFESTWSIKIHTYDSEVNQK